MPNPWLPILQTTLTHPDDHLVKLQRALFHYANVYSATTPEHLNEAEPKGTSKLDGSLFVRTAILSAERLGWVREGGGLGEWDWVGFYSTPGNTVHSWHESFGQHGK
ncbi:hypothetical protein BDQ17DRAFT_902720 [Cyathus striatus]|nr:hypothetical protein BDQ17DRAFT_902720 [Cyathus striatus]